MTQAALCSCRASGNFSKWESSTPKRAPASLPGSQVWTWAWAPYQGARLPVAVPQQPADVDRLSKLRRQQLSQPLKGPHSVTGSWKEQTEDIRSSTTVPLARDRHGDEDAAYLRH